MYTTYAGDDYETVKKNKIYKLWVRPTITWKLECEDTLPRSKAVKLFAGSSSDWSALEKGDKTNRRWAIVLIVATPLCLIAAWAFEEKSWSGQVISFILLFVA